MRVKRSVLSNIIFKIVSDNANGEFGNIDVEKEVIEEMQFDLDVARIIKGDVRKKRFIIDIVEG